MSLLTRLREKRDLKRRLQNVEEAIAEQDRTAEGLAADLASLRASFSKLRGTVTGSMRRDESGPAPEPNTSQLIREGKITSLSQLRRARGIPG